MRGTVSMRKCFTLLCTVLMMLCCCISGKAQVSVTYSSTASICYNDGTLTAAATSGIAPYTYSILSGPSGPSMNYPITLPAGSSTFSNLPAGTYVVQATDATGATGTVNGTVAGTYQFPLCNLTQAGLNIVCNASRGKPPYQYAISSTGANTGFGPYQSSNTFSNLCPGTYWVRVQDDCSNIYTTTINFDYALSYSLQCVNFTQGTLSVTGQSGRAPYTYTAVGQTNTTGVFTGLGRGYSGAFSITDACGKTNIFQLTAASAQFTGHCPFDNNIYLSHFSQTAGLPTPASVTYICTDCSPVQSVTNPPAGSPLFQGVTLGQTHSITIITSDCGGDTTHAYYTPAQAPGNLQTVYLGCNSFKVILSNAMGPINLSLIDSFVLQDFTTQATLQVNNTGIFHGIPAGAYYVTVYAPRACLSTTYTLVTVPHLPSSCSYIMMDSTCQALWEYSIVPFSSEHYTLTDAGGTTVQGRHMLRGGQPIINFYNIHPGTYTLVSDSGCTWTPAFDPVPAVGAYSYSYRSCIGRQYVHIEDTPALYCNNIRLKMYHGGNLLVNTAYPQGQINTDIQVADSGWYSYQIYAASYAGDTSLVKYDTICPIDTGSVYMGYGSVPYPYSDVLYSCGGSVLPVYHIYGGQSPYTIEMPGLDTVILHGNTGVFPTGSSGTYNIIAFDSCGISRSFTFTIQDTCTPVICAVLRARSDTTICSGSSVLLTADASEPGGTYSWAPGSGAHQDTLVAPSATATYIVSYNQSHCPVVSDTVTVTVISMPAVQVDDTSACSGQTVTLTARPTPAGGTYSWTPGAASTQSISVSPASATTYTVSYSITGCPPVSDSAIVTPLSGPYVTTYAVDAICYTPDGKAIAQATGGSPPYSYIWSDVAHTATDTLYGLLAGSSYTVTVSDQNQCSATAVVQINGTIQPLDIVQDSIADLSCAGSDDGYISISVLNSGQITYQWSPAGSDSVLTGLQPGTYSLTATDPAGCSGTMSFTIHEPPVVTLEALPLDTLIRESDAVSFTTLLAPAPSGSVTYTWTPGLGLDCNTCPRPVFQSGAGSYQYVVTANYNNVCQLTDTVRVRVYSEHILFTPNAFTPNSDGRNDIFFAYPVGAKYFNIRIFDRWGEKMFESLDPAIGWDGTYRSKLQEPGIFVYLLDVTFNDGYSVRDKGTVTLIR